MSAGLTTAATRSRIFIHANVTSHDTTHCCRHRKSREDSKSPPRSSSLGSVRARRVGSKALKIGKVIVYNYILQ